MNKFTLKVLFSAFTFLFISHFSQAQCVTKYDTLSPTICAGDTFYFNGIAHTRSTTLGGFRQVADTVVLGSGCDSITLLRLTVLRASRDSFSQSICTGTSYAFNGQTLTTSGVYRDTLRGASAYGCDSTVIVNLTVGGAVTHSITASICYGDSLLFGSGYVKTAGVHYDTVVGGVSCDSIVVLTLSYLPQPTTTITQTYCTGGSYVFNGVTITAPGIYADTLAFAASNGCDSIIRLIYETPVTRVTVRDTLCYADTLFIPGGYYILGSNGSGRYAPDTVSFGCTDTAYTYIIVVDSPATPLISASGLILTESVAGFSSYQWMLGGSNVSSTQVSYTATANGSYTVLATDARGCSALSAPYTVTGVGIRGIADDLHLLLYPNPNTGSFVLQSSGAIGEQVLIYDMLGHIAARTTISSDRMNLQLDLSEGLYLLKVKDSSGQINTLTFTIAK